MLFFYFALTVKSLRKIGKAWYYSNPYVCTFYKGLNLIEIIEWKNHGGGYKWQISKMSNLTQTFHSSAEWKKKQVDKILSPEGLENSTFRRLLKYKQNWSLPVSALLFQLVVPKLNRTETEKLQFCSWSSEILILKYSINIKYHWNFRPHATVILKLGDTANLHTC